MTKLWLHKIFLHLIETSGYSVLLGSCLPGAGGAFFIYYTIYVQRPFFDDPSGDLQPFCRSNLNVACEVATTLTIIHHSLGAQESFDNSNIGRLLDGIFYSGQDSDRMDFVTTMASVENDTNMHTCMIRTSIF